MRSFRELVQQAHGYGMRVLMDWVANHVHETHPFAKAHPDWFQDDGLCNQTVDGQQNWDRIPESCAFAPYLPDIDYAEPDALLTMLNDALWWASEYDLDGFRVDAVRHMPHAVPYNLNALVTEHLEHRHAGGDTDFYLLGETFSSYDQIQAYIGPDQLDGQFDFDLYFAIRDVLAQGQGELVQLFDRYETSRAVYGDAPMSTFLGNHDVLRFVTQAAEGDVDPCQGGQIAHAPVPPQPAPYEALRLGWTFLFTMPGRPLIYYGDEIGVPGRRDPDNRQPLWWFTGASSGLSTVEHVANAVNVEQAATLRHVKALARARPEHPALYAGTWTEWWKEPDLFAYARSHGDSHALVILNRSSTDRTLTNGLAFAGLPQGAYTDLLSSAQAIAQGDSLSVDVPARGSRVFVLQSPTEPQP